MGFNKQEYAHQCFTDDDLKRLKEYGMPHWFEINEKGKLEALLARLEAAERLGDWADHENLCSFIDRGRDGDCDCGCTEVFVAWRKSAGRE